MSYKTRNINMIALSTLCLWGAAAISAPTEIITFPSAGIGANPSCADVAPDTTGLRIDPVPAGVSFADDGDLSVVVDHYQVVGAGWFLDWDNLSSPACLVHSVIVKGGNGGNLYRYDGSDAADTGLHAILAGQSGKWAEVSHVDFCYTCELPPEGCGIGFWKNHQEFWAATAYSITQNLQTVFGTNALSSTLLAALDFPGGSGIDGGKRILLKQAVAAVLNAAHPDVNYPLSLATVVTSTVAALGSGNRNAMVALGGDLEAANSSFDCPLDDH